MGARTAKLVDTENGGSFAVEVVGPNADNPSRTDVRFPWGTVVDAGRDELVDPKTGMRRDVPNLYTNELEDVEDTLRPENYADEEETKVLAKFLLLQNKHLGLLAGMMQKTLDVMMKARKGPLRNISTYLYDSGNGYGYEVRSPNRANNIGADFPTIEEATEAHDRNLRLMQRKYPRNPVDHYRNFDHGGEPGSYQHIGTSAPYAHIREGEASDELARSQQGKGMKARKPLRSGERVRVVHKGDNPNEDLGQEGIYTPSVPANQNIAHSQGQPAFVETEDGLIEVLDEDVLHRRERG